MLAFYLIHGFAAAVHTFNFVAGILVLNSSPGVKTRLVSLGIEYTKSTSDVLACPNVYESQPDTFGTRDKVSCTGVLFDGQQVLVASELFTAIAHIFYMVNLANRKRRGTIFVDIFRVGYNPYRYVEYAVTATLLSLTSLVGTGVREVSAFILATVSLVCVQALGAITEVATAKLRASTEEKEKRQFLRVTQVSTFVVASVLQVSVFVCVFLNAFSMNSKVPGKREFTGFQSQSIVYVGQYLFFPTIAGLYAFAPRGSRFGKFTLIEFLYINAGLWAKTAIFWMVFAAVRELSEDYINVSPRTSVRWNVVRIFAIAGPPTLNFVFAVVGYWNVRPAREPVRRPRAIEDRKLQFAYPPAKVGPPSGFYQRYEKVG